MGKYTTNKQNSLTKKRNIFQRYQFLKHEILETKNNMRILEKQKIEKTKYEIDIINDEIYKEKRYLAKLEKNYSKMKKSFVRIGVTFGLALTITGNTYGTYLENKDFGNNLISAYQSVQDITYNENEILYQQLKLDIEQYVKLSRKEELTREEKQHMDNLKNRINSNPEAITMLSLDILKQKIANSIDIVDYSKIRIVDNSTQIKSDKYHSESGSKKDIVIYANDKEIASSIDFQSLSSGEITKLSDSIPKNVLNTINKIVKAQSDPQDTRKATKALESSLELDEKDISFKNEKNIEKDEER